MFGIVTVSLAMPHHVVKNERIVCDVIFKNMAFLFCLFAFFRVSNRRGKTWAFDVAAANVTKTDAAFIFSTYNILGIPNGVIFYPITCSQT